MEKRKFMKLMDDHPSLKEDLFIRGFLITEKKFSELDDFPFYGNWITERHDKYYFMAHKLTGMHIYEDEESRNFFLMGHAYNPFTMEYEEDRILAHIADAYGTPDYIERINDLTGVFVYGDIVNGRISYLVDPSGMQSACSGTAGGGVQLMLTSATDWRFIRPGDG